MAIFDYSSEAELSPTAGEVGLFLTGRRRMRHKVVTALPDDTHPPIIYPFALTASAKGDGPAGTGLTIEGEIGPASMPFPRCL